MPYNSYYHPFYYSEEHLYMLSNDPQATGNDREGNVQPSLIYQSSEGQLTRPLLPSNIAGGSLYPTTHISQVPPANPGTSIFERLLSDGNTMFNNGGDYPYGSTVFESEYNAEIGNNGNIDPGLLPSISIVTTTPQVTNDTGDGIFIPPRTSCTLEDEDLLADLYRKIKIGKRPTNVFFIYACRRRKEFRDANQRSLKTGHVRKILSKEWRALPKEENDYYDNTYNKVIDKFNDINPNYVYTRVPNGCGKNSKKGKKGKGSKAKAEILSKAKRRAA
ncbi:hypothetical protein BDQ17DRAFT_1433026 [Cyathus striatus]|nr:hypothetical protein BDQ17DRAFT_1433026 [Cyathus striatus]